MPDIIQDPFGPEIVANDLPNDRVVIATGAWAGQFGTITGKIKANGAYRIAVDRDVQTAFDRSEFVVLKKRAFPDHPGMKVSLHGVISRLPGAGPQMRKGYNGMLAEMYENLKELATRFYDGDHKAVDEFLQLYCLDLKRLKPVDTKAEPA